MSPRRRSNVERQVPLIRMLLAIMITGKSLLVSVQAPALTNPRSRDTRLPVYIAHAHSHTTFTRLAQDLRDPLLSERVAADIGNGRAA